MTYIEYLNAFNQWLETNALPTSSQLMYYKLLHVFNRAGWPEDVGVDNLRLMLMTDIKSESTVIRAREKLVEAGFIRYQKGKKGAPNRYSLAKYTVKNERETASEKGIPSKNKRGNASESDSVSASISARESASHIKTKTKKKTKSISPLTPQAADWGFGGELTAALSEWVAYKGEIGQPYPPTGMRCLLAQVSKQTEAYGEPAVAQLLRHCTSSGWRGIAWDKLEKAGRPGSGGETARGSPDNIQADMDRLEKYRQQLRKEREDGER